VRRLDTLQELAIRTAPHPHRAISACRGQQGAAAAAAELQPCARRAAAGDGDNGAQAAPGCLDIPQQPRACRPESNRTERVSISMVQQPIARQPCQGSSSCCLQFTDEPQAYALPTHRCCRLSCEGLCRTGRPRRPPPPAASRRAAWIPPSQRSAQHSTSSDA
jgi:hypothetical protein